MTPLLREGVQTSSILFGQETPANPRIKQGSSEVVVTPQAMDLHRPGSFVTTHPGGGGNSGGACSPMRKGLLLTGSDTSGPRFSLDGGAHSRFTSAGLVGGIQQQQAVGFAFSAVVDGLAFYATGNGTTGKGGLYVLRNVGRPYAITKPRRLDGVLAGSTKLRFNGGQNTDARMNPVQGNYPRWYGAILRVRDFVEDGVAHVYMATYGDGLVRIRYRYSDDTVLSQDTVTGSEGLLIRWVLFDTDDANMAAGGTKLIFSPYDASSGGTPAKPRRCDNAFDTTGATLTSTECSNLPTNVEAAHYWAPAGAGVVPMTTFVANGYVGMSTNAFTAAPGSVTAQSLARTVAQNDGPETTTIWAACGGDSEAGFNYVIVGAAMAGRKITVGGVSTWAAAYVAKVSATSSTPWSGITWTRLDGPDHWSEDLMDDPARPWWLTGVSAPGVNGTASISYIYKDPLTPGRLFGTCKGNTFRTDNHGYRWYPIRNFGSADHTVVKSDSGAFPQDVGTTTGDFPFVITTPNPGQEPFADVEPVVVLADDKYAGSGCFSDPRNGDWFFGFYYNTPSAGHDVPDQNINNDLFLAKRAQLGATNAGSALTDLKLYTSTTAGAAVGGVHDGFCEYGSASTPTSGRTVCVATKGGNGMVWSKNLTAATPTWNKLVNSAGAGAALQPFSTAWQGRQCSVVVDRIRKKAYFWDRGNSTGWRVDVAADGSCTATPIAYATGGIAVSRDAAGYFAVDPDSDRAYFATTAGIWYINNASTAPAITSANGLANATATAFGTYYPGELPGPIGWARKHRALCVSTLGYSDGNGTSPYPRNGTDGPRALFVVDPDVATQWAPDVAADLGVTIDRGYKLAMYLPKFCDVDPVGVRWIIGQQGSGAGCFYLPLEPVSPVTDTFSSGGTLSPTRWPNTVGSPTINLGKMRLPCTTSSTGAYTAYVFDLRDTPVTVGLATLPNPGNGGTRTEVWLRANTASKQIKFVFTGDLSTVICTGAGFNDQSFTVAPAARRHLRFRLSDDKASILWQVSGDRIVWNTLRTEPVPAWLVGERLRAMFVTSYTGTETNPGYAEFDRFNA